MAEIIIREYIGDEDGWLNGRTFFEKLIRCKDCKYWQDNNGGYPHEDCKWNHDETPDGDDYCSGGEKCDKEPTAPTGFMSEWAREIEEQLDNLKIKKENKQ